MNFELTPEQLRIQKVIHDFGRKEIAPKVAEYDREERFPLEIVKKVAELGFMGGVIPEKYSGAGLDYKTLVTVVESFSRYCHIIGLCASLSSGLHGGGIYKYGSEEQKLKYLAPICRGEKFGAAGVTEPHSGTDVAAMETTVKKDGEHYVINGTKTWISFLDVAEWVLTFATLDKAKKHRGICAFIIDRGTPGLSFRPFKNKVGFRPVCTGEVILEDVRVHKSQLVGEEGEGFRVAMAAVEEGRLGVAARAVGVAQACLEEAVAYAQQRIVFDQPIGRFQLVQSKITDMVVGIESARLLTYRLADLKDRGLRARREASIAKMYATDVLMKAATDAFQIFGAYGCSDEYNVGRYFRDAKIFQIIEGQNDLHRAMIAEFALGYRRE
jgi:alkylation response protein AidB-like acyl-CoA dehydrogenase